jgi:signal transduction histidine kinase
MDTHETKIYIALLIVAVFLGIFLLFFIITILRHQRRNQELHKEKINAEINTMEKERTRIASDLHDDLGPMLSAVKLLINNLELITDEDQETLSRANDYIDGVLLQLRTISNNLVPQALSRKGLVVAVDEFISELNEKRPMHIDFRYSDSLSIPSSKGIHLWRIIHEVIHNADKHAKASLMKIQLEEKNEKLILRLHDNGCGFDSKDLATVQKGLGLKNIISRVETLKGNIYIDSAPQRGTDYSIEIPMIQTT